MKDESALVVLSGGQDSTTCLYWAKREFSHVFAISFDYGQRHYTELAAAKRIADQAQVPHKVVDLKGYGAIAPSALTRDHLPVNEKGIQELPMTFTPGRNLVFLTMAASYAAASRCTNVVTGVCQTDYSGYPDCRDETIKALEAAISLGIYEPMKIHTPLMFLTKAETVKLAHELGKECWSAIRETVTCYHGFVPGCGGCPACVLRDKGFQEAGVTDPARL